MMKTLKQIQCMAVMLCGVATLWSCSDELEHGGIGFSSDAIVFNGGLSEEWNTPSGTRSAAGKDSVMNRTQKFENAELYLHTTVTPGIEEDSSFAVTRASEIDGTSITDYTFGVYAYAMRKESDSDTFDPSKAAEYIVDQEVSHNGSKWTYSPVRFWPASDDYLMQFIGYAPYNAMTIKAENNTPTIDYTVPERVADQKDLLVCSIVRESANRTPVSLHFDHICTAVKFVVGDIDGTIHSIALKGVRNKGTFDMNTGQWTLDETVVDDFTQSLEKNLGYPSTEGAEITLNSQTFMMLPQTLPEGAQIEVVYSEGEFNTKRTLTHDISGNVWRGDETVKYKVSASKIDVERVFDIGVSELEIQDFSNTVSRLDRTYTVTSYAKYNGVSYDKTWNRDYDCNGNGIYGESDDKLPDWLSYVPMSANSYKIIVTARNGSYVDYPQNTWLKSQNEKGITTPYNLSNDDEGNPGGADVVNTANCYIVNAPGTYSFPLVYGNAIKNRATYEDAYKLTDLGQNGLNDFINHAGVKIVSPWIAENYEDEAHENQIALGVPMLVWQDAQSLITKGSIQLTGNSAQDYRIQFNISRDNIQQGNAVIAICNTAGDILWSWHIWVTDWNSGKGMNGAKEVKTVTRSTPYRMMSVNLGWRDGGIYEYPARNKVTIRFTQTDNKEHKYFTIEQRTVRANWGNAPYYQWGRKDPMFNSGKYYDIDNNEIVFTAESDWEGGNKGVISESILSPHIFCNNLKMAGGFLDLWGASNAGSNYQSQATVKTIYDPCPVGYKIPVNNMFRAFTSSGGEVTLNTQGKSIKGKWNALYNGWNFDTDDAGDKVFFPATALREPSSASVIDKSDGAYWSAVPSQIGEYPPYRLTFNYRLVNPQAKGNSKNRASGLAVRPVQE